MSKQDRPEIVLTGGRWGSSAERYWWTHRIGADLGSFVAVEMRMFLAAGTQAVLRGLVEKSYCSTLPAWGALPRLACTRFPL